jgi:hypothetical protein
LYRLVEDHGHTPEEWTLRLDRKNLDGTSTHLAFFRKSERKIAESILAFLNATASIQLV